MTLNHYLKLFLRQWKTVALVTVVLTALAAGLTLLTQPSYTSTVTVTLVPQGVRNTNEAEQATVYAEAQTGAFAALATSPKVLAATIKDTGSTLTPEQLAAQVIAAVIPGSAAFTIEVTDSSLEMGNALSTAIAEQIVRQSADLLGTNSNIVVAVFVPTADAPTMNGSPLSRNIPAGVVLGVLLGALWVLVSHWVRNTVETAEGLAATADVPVLGELAPEKANDEQLAEGYRRLRAMIQGIGFAERPHTLAVTSVAAHPRTAEVAGGLATAFSEDQATVQLINANFRQHDVAHTTTAPTLVAVDGQPLNSRAIEQLLQEAASRNDVSIVLAAPLQDGADGLALASAAGGTLALVSRSDTRNAVNRAVNTINATNGRVIGLLLAD